MWKMLNSCTIEIQPIDNWISVARIHWRKALLNVSPYHESFSMAWYLPWPMSYFNLFIVTPVKEDLPRVRSVVKGLYLWFVITDVYFASQLYNPCCCVSDFWMYLSYHLRKAFLCFCASDSCGQRNSGFGLSHSYKRDISWMPWANFLKFVTDIHLDSRMN